MHQMVHIIHTALITKLSCFIPCGSVWYLALVGDTDRWCGPTMSWLGALHIVMHQMVISPTSIDLHIMHKAYHQAVLLRSLRLSVAVMHQMVITRYMAAACTLVTSHIDPQWPLPPPLNRQYHHCSLPSQ